jgi:hypothetical protein
MKLRRMRRAGNVAHMGHRRGAYMILVERPEENDHLEDLGIDRTILSKWILSRMCRYRHEFSGSL